MNISFRIMPRANDAGLGARRTLGDGVGNDGHTVDVTPGMRTAPLWGLFLWSLYRRTASYSTTTHPRRAA